MESTCTHCGSRIVLINWLTGPGWTHQPAGAAFQDGQHRYCHSTVATPRESEAEHLHAWSKPWVGVSGNREYSCTVAGCAARRSEGGPGSTPKVGD